MNFKLADFGSGSWANSINPRYSPSDDFKPPEVLLGSPRGTSMDIWNAACLIFEMATGRALFYHYASGDGNPVTHMTMIIARLGAVPEDLINSGLKRDDFFTKQGVFRGAQRPPHSILEFSRAIILADGIQESEKETKNFAGFISAMTTLRPTDHMKASDLLHHAWLIEVS